MVKKDGKILCDSCGFYRPVFVIQELKGSKEYCSRCIKLGLNAWVIRNQINYFDVEEIAKGLISEHEDRKLKKDENKSSKKKKD